jgi:hypothetical protein
VFCSIGRDPNARPIDPDKRVWSHELSHPSDPGIVALCRLLSTDPANLLEPRFRIASEWRIITPIEEAWAQLPVPDFPNYAAGKFSHQKIGMKQEDNKSNFSDQLDCFRSDPASPSARRLNPVSCRRTLSGGTILGELSLLFALEEPSSILPPYAGTARKATNIPVLASYAVPAISPLSLIPWALVRY